MTPGEFLGISKAIARVAQYFDLARREAELRAREKQLALQELELRALREKDAEIRQSSRKGVELAVDQLVNGHWTSQNQLRIPFNVAIHNRWVYPVKLEKMAVYVRLNNADEYELPLYGEEFSVLPLSIGLARREFEWTFGDHQSVVRPDQITTTSFTARVAAYFTSSEGERFDVGGTLSAVALIHPSVRALNRQPI